MKNPVKQTEEFETANTPRPTPMALYLYFLKLGCIGFGGAIALISYMQTDLVEKRQWISKTDFLHGLSLSQFSPGPLATQLAIYIGWIYGKTLGATLVLLSFTFPSFIIVVILAMCYSHYGDMPWVHGVFYGIGASVIAIITKGAYKLAKLVIDRNPLLCLIYLINLIITVWLGSASISLFILSGLMVLLINKHFHFTNFRSSLFYSSSLSSLILIFQNTINNHFLLKMFFYFAGAGAFVFGSGLSILPYVHDGVVNQYHWVTEQQFMDAVAVGMITPGPLVMMVSFIGYLMAGISGAFIAICGVLMPCYLIILFIAPHYSRFAHNKSLKAMVSGITAAAAGAILGATIILSQKAIIDLNTLLIFILTFLIPLFIKRIPDPVLVLASGVLGYFLK